MLGDGYFTRIFSRADVGRAAFNEPSTVTVRFRDFTLTGGNFTFADATTARWVATALQPAGGRGHDFPVIEHAIPLFIVAMLIEIWPIRTGRAQAGWRRAIR